MKLKKSRMITMQRRIGFLALGFFVLIMSGCLTTETAGLQKQLQKSASPAESKKLIRVGSELCSRLLGSNSISEADLPEKVKVWQDRGLDGLVFTIASHDPSKGETNMTGQWWNPTARRGYEEFIPEIKAFQSVKDWGKLTDNFLWSSMAIWGSPPYNALDWFNDAQWKAVLDNVRLQVRIAKECGFKGIVLDTEQYNHHAKGPWRFPFSYVYYAVKGGYKLTGETAPRPFAECTAKVRERAREYAEAVCEVYPNITLFVIPGLYDEMHGAKSLNEEDIKYNAAGLYPAFCDGLLLGLDKRASIIAGTESTYDASEYEEMLNARRECKETSIAFSTVPELARRRIQFAAGVWADSKGKWSDTDVNTNVRNPDTHKHAVHNALAASDKYGWLYGEQSMFLTTEPTKLMREYFQANIEAHQPQDLLWKPKPR